MYTIFLHFRYNPDMLVQANSAVENSYGGFYQRVTNVIYTNGLIDPWFYHGISFAQEPALAFNLERNLQIFNIRN